MTREGNPSRFDIRLVNMPFSAAGVPSIALAQLGSVVERAHGSRVAVSTHYFNQEFSAYLRDGGLCDEVDFSLESGFNGLGDWLFRQAAFPETEDNSRTYFNRYYPRTDARTVSFKERVLERRQGIVPFLDDLIGRYGLDRADLVGFTSMFSQTVASLAMARRLKELRPGILIVMGGANCEAPMGQELIRNAPYVNHVFSGPALISFPRYVAHALAGELDCCDSIPGVLGRSRPDPAPDQVFGEELDISEVVPLDYQPFFEGLARLFPEMERAPVFFETSRGCWWGQRAHCPFCGLNGSAMSYRAMEPQGAIRQFESLFERYGSRASYFFGVDAIMPQNYVRDVFPHIQAPAEAPLFYEVKAGLSEGDLQVMSRHGIRRIQPGIESFSSSSLKTLRKGTTPFRNIQQLIQSRRLGIQVTWNLLFGFPGEAEETYEQHMRLLPRLVHLEPPTGAHVLRFDRYSPFFNEAESHGLELEPHAFYALTYPFPEDSLRRFAYFFEDHNYSAPYRAALAHGFHAIKRLVDAWRDRWQRVSPDARPTLERRRGRGTTVVFDSRGNEPREHDVGPLGLRMLSVLETPHRPEGLENELGDVDPGEVRSTLQALDAAGLLFAETGRYLSLVLPDRCDDSTHEQGISAHVEVPPASAAAGKPSG